MRQRWLLSVRFAAVAAIASSLALTAPKSASAAGIGYAYDDYGRLVSATYEDGRLVVYRYDDAGNRVAVSQGKPSVFTVSDAQITEGQDAVFTINRVGQNTLAITVKYRTEDRSAVAGSDYTNRSGTLTFAPSDQTKTVSVPVASDSIYEGSENFALILEDPSNGAVLGPGADSASGAILDATAAPQFALSGGGAVVEGQPLSLTVNLVGASSISHSVRLRTITGTAASGTDYEARDESLTFAPGESSKAVSIRSIDDSIYEGQENFTVALSEASNGAGIQTGTAPLTLVENEQGPIFSISGANLVAEGFPGSYTITKTGETTLSHSVTFSTQAGTAIAGNDFTTASGTVTFSPGETSKPVTVFTVDDSIFEGPENYSVALSSPTLGATLGQSTVTTQIADSETAPSFSAISAGSVIEGQVATFTVTRNGSSTLSHSVSYTTQSGSAVTGSDFTSASGTLTFAPGQSSLTVPVQTANDTLVEPNEAFSLSIGSPTNGASIAVASAAATILDNDGAPSFAISAPSAVTEGQTVSFTVTKLGSTSLSHNVSYATQSGSAVSGTDFTGASGTLTFAQSETAKTFTVPTTDDTAFEPNETFSAVISNATNGATISAGNTATVSINNNDADPAPGIPSSISPATLYSTTGTYTISWGASTGTITRYELFRRIEPNTTETMPYSGPGLSFSISNGANGDFHYRVRACNSLGCSQFREEAFVSVCKPATC